MGKYETPTLSAEDNLPLTKPDLYSNLGYSNGGYGYEILR